MFWLTRINIVNINLKFMLELRHFAGTYCMQSVQDFILEN